MAQAEIDAFLDLSTELAPSRIPPWYRRRVRAVKRRVVRRAIEKKVATEPRNLVVRDILPKTDLGFTNEEWKASLTATANTWAEYVRKTLDDDEMIVFTGIVIHTPNPNITFIKFSLGDAKVKAIFSLTKAYVQDEPIIVFKTPIKYENKETIKIEVYTTEANPTVYIELLGYKVEPVGKTIGEKKG